MKDTDAIELYKLMRSTLGEPTFHQHIIIYSSCQSAYCYQWGKHSFCDCSVLYSFGLRWHRTDHVREASKTSERHGVVVEESEHAMLGCGFHLWGDDRRGREALLSDRHKGSVCWLDLRDLVLSYCSQSYSLLLLPINFTVIIDEFYLCYRL